MHTVTGATGLVGAHLVYELLQRHSRVRAIHRAGSDREFLRKVFGYYSKDADALFEKIDFVEADLLDIPALEKALEGTTHLYHCAAIVSFAPQDRKEVIFDNAAMTAAVVDAAISRKVEKMVHVSSVAALGRQPGQEHFDEESHWNDSGDNSSYALGKYRAELEVWRGMQEGLNAVILSPSIILGPGRWHRGSGAIFSNIAGGFKYYSRGVNGFVDVRDVAALMDIFMRSDREGERYVVTAGNFTYKEVFQGIADALGVRRPSVEIKPFMSGIAWRVEALRSALTGKRPLVTRDSAKIASQQYFYHTDKLHAAVDFEFRPLQQSLKEICGFYKDDHS